MKIVICTAPIRPVPTNCPPFGSLAIIQALRAAGYDPYFYDIDGMRFPFDQVEAFFAERQPDVLGISAVVSTAYDYTKKLIHMVKRVSPKTRVIVGGNLVASAEILHRLASADYCVSGDGEIVAVNLMNYIRGRVESGRPGDDYAALREIKGISYLDPAGDMAFTGFERRLHAEEFSDPDFGILEKYSNIDIYINDPLIRPDFVYDARTYQPHRKGKKMVQLNTSKGCVARCTFCHRWDKGYRTIEVETIIRQLRHMIDHYNVGFVQIGDENFGSDRRQVNEFIEAIKPFDILYDVAGVRSRTVDADLLKRLKDSGCVAAYYGMETGSARILEVMEKNLKVEHSLNAARWTAEQKLYSVYQLVLGMPGESPETIDETIEVFKQATEILDEPPLRRLSINFIQALPGTPTYEYARHKGLLGKSLAEEEAYLTLVSDTEADDDTKFINFTDWDNLTVQSWRRRIILECTANYIKKRGTPPPSLKDMYQHTILRVLNPRKYRELKQKFNPNDGLDYNKGGYFNLQRGLYYDIIAHYFYPIRTPLLWSWQLTREFGRLGPKRFAEQVWQSVSRRVFGPTHDAYNDYRSLRKVVDAMAPPPKTPSEEAMATFRAGR